MSSKELILCSYFTQVLVGFPVRRPIRLTFFGFAGILEAPCLCEVPHGTEWSQGLPGCLCLAQSLPHLLPLRTRPEALCVLPFHSGHLPQEFSPLLHLQALSARFTSLAKWSCCRLASEKSSPSGAEGFSEQDNQEECWVVVSSEQAGGVSVMHSQQLWLCAQSLCKTTWANSLAWRASPHRATGRQWLLSQGKTASLWEENLSRLSKCSVPHPWAYGQH